MEYEVTPDASRRQIDRSPRNGCRSRDGRQVTLELGACSRTTPVVSRSLLDGMV